MRQRILRYTKAMLMVMCIIGGILLLSDVGYIYLYIWQWQIQTSVLILVILWLILIWSVYIVAQLLKKIQQLNVQKNKSIQKLTQFYRYEQNGFIYLLQIHYPICEHHFKLMLNIYQTSLFLRPLIKAHIAFQHQHYDKALYHLQWVDSHCFEFKELQLIQIYLAQNNAKKSLTHLLVLEYSKQKWLEELEEVYQKKIDSLWIAFAIQFPMIYIQQQKQYLFTADEWQKFSHSLWQHLQEIKMQGLEIPFERKHLQFLESNIYQQNQADCWYQIMRIISQDDAEQYFNHMIQQQFNEKLFNHWLYDQQKHLEEIIPLIEQWQKQYHDLPCLQFAKVLIYLQQQQYDLIRQIIQQPYQHPILQYIRDNMQTLELISISQLWALFEIYKK